MVGEEAGRMEQYCFIPFKQVALLDWKTAVREVEGEKTQIFPSNTFIWGEIYILETNLMLKIESNLV